MPLTEPAGGFARIRCPNCRAEHLLAFSCRTRNFCPSCQAKRSALFAEHVITEIIESVPHRHVVLTIPRVLRGLFQRERRLLGLLARAARDAIVPGVRAILDRHDATPGLVVSIQTFGSYAANFHPHVHALVTDGAFTAEGEFLQLPYFDARLVVPARLAGREPHPEPIPSPSRASWARLLRRIFEVNPLLCPACGSKMKIVSVITEPNVIDAILRHLARTGGRDPFEGRAPPAA
jgi:hypothetical protein